MARTLAEVNENEIVTLNKIKADRAFRTRMMNLGIGEGCDITVIDRNDDGSLKVESGVKTLEFSAEDAAKLIVGEQFKRHMDPMLWGGCCAYGNTAGALDLAEQVNAIFDVKE